MVPRNITKALNGEHVGTYIYKQELARLLTLILEILYVRSEASAFKAEAFFLKLFGWFTFLRCSSEDPLYEHDTLRYHFE